MTTPLHSAEVFVFGSNLAGRHGKGAALHAVEHWGAVIGEAEGLQGNAYAIPTKDYHLRPLSLEKIAESFERFVAFAADHPGKRFLLTPIGTGLAGHHRRDIWKIIKSHPLPENIVLTSSWVTG